MFTLKPICWLTDKYSPLPSKSAPRNADHAAQQCLSFEPLAKQTAAHLPTQDSHTFSPSIISIHDSDSDSQAVSSPLRGLSSSWEIEGQYGAEYADSSLEVPASKEIDDSVADRSVTASASLPYLQSRQQPGCQISDNARIDVSSINKDEIKLKPLASFLDCFMETARCTAKYVSVVEVDCRKGQHT
jgi:hypothetical protein